LQIIDEFENPAIANTTKENAVVCALIAPVAFTDIN